MIVYYPPDDDYTLKAKLNGHHGLFSLQLSNKEDGTLTVSCNNETMIFRSFKMNPLVNIGHYHYLQTYEHITRGEPDENGYYARSTEEEVIKYIKYLQKEYTK